VTRENDSTTTAPLRLDVTIRKPKSPYRDSKKVVDIDATATFIGAAMEKTNPPYLFTIAGEEKEETNLPYRETQHGQP
jgi:hypothetical protein